MQERIEYVLELNQYEAIRPDDEEACQLIHFLGFNDHPVSEERRKHVAKLKDLFDQAEWSAERRLEWLGRHRSELSFPTALEAALGLDLTALIAAPELAGTSRTGRVSGSGEPV